MSYTKAQAKGATLQVKDSTWQAVNGVGDFSFQPFTIDIIDVTTHDSANNAEEMLPGIHKAAKITVPIVWCDADTIHAFLLTNNGTVQPFKYTGAGAATAYAFNAIVELLFDNKVKDAKRATLTLTISDGNTPS